MKYISLTCSYKGVDYHFSPPFGFVTASKRSTADMRRKLQLVPKVNLLLERVRNPFLLSCSFSINLSEKSVSWNLERYAKLLVWLYHNFYFGLYLLSKIRLNIFDNAIEATDVFCRIIGNDEQKVLCLPRSIFAATTSKRFREHGAMFIGIFLPSHHLHAWVIEDEHNAWRNDAIWINYTPISIMV